MTRKLILHLCADTGSDTWPYQQDPAYEVHRIGSDIGVENYTPPLDRRVHGIIANPVCTEFSRVRRGKPGERYPHVSDPEAGFEMVQECIRIINLAEPVWHAIENPATGTLKDYLGEPDFTYEPWQYGSPWTKRTALWGNFNRPQKLYTEFADVPLIDGMWIRPGRKPSIAWWHKSAWQQIPEFRDSGMPAPGTDAEFRSLCSQNFAQAFKEANP